MADAIPLFDDGRFVPCKASSAVLGKRVVKISGNFDANGNIQVAHAGAGEKFFGVAQFDSAAHADDYVTVATGTDLIMPVTAGEALAAGDSVMVGAAGVAMKAAGGAGAVIHCFGEAVSAAANGADAFIKIRPHSVTV